MTVNSSHLNELRQKRASLGEEFGQLQNGSRNVNEFFGKINPLINDLILEQKWKDLIGNEYIKSLRSLLINLSSQVKTYNDLNNIGNYQQAKIELNNSQVVALQLIDEIDSIIENLGKSSKNTNKEFKSNPGLQESDKMEINELIDTSMKNIKGKNVKGAEIKTSRNVNVDASMNHIDAEGDVTGAKYEDKD